jgi:type IV pilus assembly protein PilQ
MRNNLKLFVFISVLLLSACLPKSNAEETLPFYDSEVTISLDLQNASLKDVLKIFSVQSGLNFISSESVQDRAITLYLDKVPVKEAMEKLFKANNLAYDLEKDSNIFIVKDLGKPQIETLTKVFYLKHATVSSSSLKEEMAAQMRASSTTDETTGSAGAGGAATSASTTTGKWATEDDTGITKVIKKLLSEYGSLVEDFRTNSLIVTDVPSRMPIIAQTIAALDVPIPQVMLEVEMLDVSKNAVDKLGFEFGQTPFTAVLTGGTLGLGFPFHSWARTYTDPDTARGNLAVNTSPNTYQVQLDFLKTQTDTKYLARPRILTLNNETAEIKITTDEAVGEKKSVSGEAGSTTTTTEAERYETGVSLRVTPQINPETGEITMFIVPKASQASASGITSSTGVKFFNPETRTTKSIVRVKDGETIIVGGLIRNDTTEEFRKLPILGDLPVLGALFRHVNREPNRERELLVFITPHIIKEPGMELARANKMRLPEREQSPVSGFERQLAIGASLNNFEKKQK